MITWNANANINGTSLVGIMTFRSHTDFDTFIAAVSSASGQNYRLQACDSDGEFFGEFARFDGDPSPAVFTLYDRHGIGSLHIGLLDYDVALDLYAALGALAASFAVSVEIRHHDRFLFF